MKKMVNINISNRTFILIAILLLIITAGGFVIAYNSSPANPAYFGHSANEVLTISQRFTSPGTIAGEWQFCFLTYIGTTTSSFSCAVSQSGTSWVLSKSGVDSACYAQCIK